jgi:AcrR family transcriptional regulator
VRARTAPNGRPRIPPRPAPEEAGTDPRERILRTAYELFTQHGLGTVGVDRIVADAEVSKMTLYRHFRSKDELIAAVIERHCQLWLENWLEPTTLEQDGSPAERLLAVFVSLNEWFADENFQGCLLLNSVLETHDRSSTVRRTSLHAIDGIYEFLARLASETGAADPERLAQRIHLLMRGAIVAATEGRPYALREGQEAARQLVQEAVNPLHA